MSELNDIVQVEISRETQSLAQFAFGIPAVISKFTTDKTTTTFVRHRYYTSLADMTTDGWTVYDYEYKAAQKLFSQNPRPSSIMIGRQDAGDANLTAALSAIQLASANWYAWTHIPSKTALFTFAGDLITGNKVDIVINGVTVAQVTFSGDMQTTMGLIETAVEAAIAGSTFTVSSTPFRTATLVLPKLTTPSSITIAITAGATQTTCAVTLDSTATVQAYKDCAAWNETQMKLFFFSDSDSVSKTSGTTDLGTFMKGLNYDRTICIYNPYAMGDMAAAFQEVAWIGQCLPFDPGSLTWAFKTLTGVSAIALTPAERGFLIGKNINIYTTTAGVDITESGVVASGEYIDIMQGVDWITAQLQAAVFTQLINVKKIPFTDEGVELITSQVRSVLNIGANQGILVKESIVVTSPLVSEVSAADKAARTLPDVDFTATLQGAIHKIEINGTVTL